MDRPARPGDLVPIPRAECVELLAGAMFVRIGFISDGRPMVLPVNHVVHRGAVYFRTGPGSKLGTAAADGQVVVEADEGDQERRIGWSVVAQGHASIVTDEAEVESLHGLSFEPWALPDDRAFWIRVDVADFSGRRILRTG